jgi:hypothetical protein
MDQSSGSDFSHPQNQELGKFILNGASDPLEPGKALPETYGDNRLVILPRDPLWFFAYWEATSDRLDALRDQVGHDLWQKGQAVLRAYDMSGQEGDLSHANRFFDIGITFDARRWYVNVPEPGHSWVVELGFKFPDGRFLALLRSNRITLPTGAVSNQTDSRWMIVNMDEWEKMFEVAGPRGSAEIAKMMGQRWEFFRSVFSGSSSGLSGSTSRLSGSSAPANEKTNTPVEQKP